MLVLPQLLFAVAVAGLAYGLVAHKLVLMLFSVALLLVVIVR